MLSIAKSKYRNDALIDNIETKNNKISYCAHSTYSKETKYQYINLNL